MLSNIRTLHLRCTNADMTSKNNLRIMEYVAHHIFPWIDHLTVDVLVNPSPGELLPKCPRLRRFGVEIVYYLPGTAKEEITEWPHLESLAFSYNGRAGPIQLSSLQWLFQIQATVKSLYLGKSPRSRSNWDFLSLSLLPGFTALNFLSLSINTYYFIIKTPERATEQLPFSELPRLQNVTFQIAAPRHQTWERFFLWIGDEIILRSPSILEVCLELWHPSLPSSNVTALRTAQLGVGSRGLLFSHFNRLATGSRVRLNFILMHSEHYYPSWNSTDEERLCGFEVVASVINRWLSAWREEGKLEIRRRS
ncbi:hypothetical protein DL96DRAFT_1580919 [Flagelloscypha sp. PMI_526]|nr:hypothetical protein DL96DRAFT_1580919 [Flagelloscypha sp. PMI_526]